LKCSEWKGNSIDWLAISSVEVPEEAAAEVGKYRACICILLIKITKFFKCS
jgi:hypothetical protein